MTFTIFSKPSCTYCEQAKNLFSANSVEYEEIILDFGQSKQPGKVYFPLNDFKQKYPEQKTVPMILKDGEHFGGFNELQAFFSKDPNVT